VHLSTKGSPPHFERPALKSAFLESQPRIGTGEWAWRSHVDGQPSMQGGAQLTLLVECRSAADSNTKQACQAQNLRKILNCHLHLDWLVFSYGGA